MLTMGFLANLAQMHQAQMQARFQHEQRLITTAWYNMSVRLQEISIFDHLPGARYVLALSPLAGQGQGVLWNIEFSVNRK